MSARAWRYARNAVWTAGGLLSFLVLLSWVEGPPEDPCAERDCSFEEALGGGLGASLHYGILQFFLAVAVAFLLIGALAHWRLRVLRRAA